MQELLFHFFKLILIKELLLHFVELILIKLVSSIFSLHSSINLATNFFLHLQFS